MIYMIYVIYMIYMIYMTYVTYVTYVDCELFEVGNYSLLCAANKKKPTSSKTPPL